MRNKVKKINKFFTKPSGIRSLYHCKCARARTHAPHTHTHTHTDIYARKHTHTYFAKHITRPKAEVKEQLIHVTLADIY